MSKIEQVTKLKKLRAVVTNYDWSFSGDAVATCRLFHDDGQRTEESSISGDNAKLLSPIMAEVERSSGNVIWTFSGDVGSYIKKVVLRRLDRAIRLAAEKAKSEAEGVLSILGRETKE